jgi:phosphatidylglycerophosphate synthase
MARLARHHLPNLITLARMGLVPVLILLLHEQRYGAALAVFVAIWPSAGGYRASSARFSTQPPTNCCW